MTNTIPDGVVQLSKLQTSEVSVIIVGSQADNINGGRGLDGHRDLDVFIRKDNHQHVAELGALKRMGYRVDSSVLPNDVYDVLEGHVGYHCVEDGIWVLVPSVKAMVTLRASHLPWDIKWWKHASTVVTMLPKTGIDDTLYSVFRKHWGETHEESPHLSLYKTKDEFFNDAVEYVYDHDFLHELVADGGVPIYQTVLKDNQDVYVDWAKFLQLPREKQVQMFREEVAVIACERFMIAPRAKGKYNLKQAWDLALQKTVTALTKGKSTDFMIYNLHEYVDYGEAIKLMMNVLKEVDKDAHNRYTNAHKLTVQLRDRPKNLVDNHEGYDIIEIDGELYRQHLWFTEKVKPVQVEKIVFE